MSNLFPDGNYTQIPHVQLETVSRMPLKLYEWQVLIIVWRKIYGYQKRVDAISASQIMELTAIKQEANVRRTFSGLVRHGILRKVGRQLIKSKWVTVYQIQEDVSKWVISPPSEQSGVSEQIPDGDESADDADSRIDAGVSVETPLGVSVEIPTIESIKDNIKDNNQDNNIHTETALSHAVTKETNSASNTSFNNTFCGTNSGSINCGTRKEDKAVAAASASCGNGIAGINGGLDQQSKRGAAVSMGDGVREWGGYNERPPATAPPPNTTEQAQAKIMPGTIWEAISDGYRIKVSYVDKHSGVVQVRYVKNPNGGFGRPIDEFLRQYRPINTDSQGQEYA